MKKIAYILIFICTLFSGCSQRPDEIDFMVVYTSEMYGNVLHWDFKTDTTAKVSLANFMSLVKEQRSIYDDRCIVLDIGNMHTRGLTNLYWRYIDTICEPLTYKAQRYIGYDAVAIGHSDIRLSEPFEAVRHDTTLCPPTICMNIIDQRTGQPCFRPWICLERQGIRIAIFSLVDEDADGWTPILGSRDATCVDMVESMREQILNMRHQCKPDLVIGLVSSPKEIDELNLQAQIPGIDYLIGIKLSEDPNIRNNQYAGMVTIKMKRDTHTDSYSKQFFNVAVDMSQYEIDHEFSAYFEPDVNLIREEYKKEFGILPDDIFVPYGLYSPHDYYRDILNQAQLWYSGADVSLTNIANASNNRYIEAGPVSIRRVCDIFTHENLLVTFYVKGHELKDIIESFYGPQYNKMTSINDHLIALGHDKKGHQRWDEQGRPYLNVPASRYATFAGVQYIVDLRRGPGDRVNISGFRNGKTFHPDSVYTITTNSYLAAGMGNTQYVPYLKWQPKEIRNRFVNNELPNLIYVLYKYFKDCDGAYTHTTDFDCDFVPVEWWNAAKKREIDSLNPTW